VKFESLRISDQLRRAFFGDAWHGPSLRELLTGIDCEMALARPLPSVHCIWELVLHIDLWASVAFEAIEGTPMPRLYGTEEDWPSVVDGSASAWTLATEHLLETGERLARAIEGLDDSRLLDTVPGREYDLYYLFHGIVQHSLYHGGQIAMLKAQRRTAVSTS
jgi:hypothetical protein